MIQWDKATDTVTMDLVDLEHCGFDVAEYRAELYVAGIDDEAAGDPASLVVNFRAGHVVMVEMAAISTIMSNKDETDADHDAARQSE